MSQSLFAQAALATAALLPPVSAILYARQGGTTLPDGTVTPNCVAMPVSIRVQPATSADLTQCEGLNQTTQTRTVYLQGSVHGLERTHQFGGDTLFFEGSEWLVTGQPEIWGATQWSRLLVTRQITQPPSQA